MLWRILRRLEYRQFFGLLRLFLRNPIYAIPTLIATKQCMSIAYRQYGSKHHLNNKANAFRHALWVILIIQKALEWKKDETRAKVWAKQFSDLHEDLSPNAPLERAMDLHNNLMGIVLFEKIGNRNIRETISILKLETENAVKISAVEEIEQSGKKLVYIE